jgi:hypothetical protein
MRRVIVAPLATRGGPPDEQGAILILVAFLTVTIVAMAAMVVDVGAILDEKRQLQNGADAGALAVARSCALGACNIALAESLADLNSRDGDSKVEPVTPNLVTRQVRVTVSTQGGGGNILPYSFGQVITGQKGRMVRASATASWTTGGPATASAVPIAVSDCEVGLLVVGAPAVILLTKPSGTCVAKYPGGNFGWLDADCPDTYTVGVPADGDPGKSGPKTCLGPLINTEVTFPVFDTVTGKGSKAEYRIVGFLVLKLTGWRFPGDASPTPPCSSSATCVAGTFIRYITTGTSGVSLVS